MDANCGHYVKSYRAKQCPYCKKWMCPACHSEHINSLETHCVVIQAFSPNRIEILLKFLRAIK